MNDALREVRRASKGVMNHAPTGWGHCRWRVKKSWRRLRATRGV